MHGPLLPGEVIPFPRRAPLRFLVHQFQQHEQALRSIGAQVLEVVPADDDLAVAIRRTLDALDL
jgi:hypothetical protein